jgi:WD40 repeat protein
MANTATHATDTGSSGDNRDVSTVSSPNAYVGPQPFPPDRQLYGRDRELLALTNRLLSERLVLFYSPSGAGKTSLIRAKGGLQDRMTGEGFRPLPVVRVSHAADVAVRVGVNRYLLSALVSLELARPEPDQRTAATLAQFLRLAEGGRSQLSFDEYLAGLTPATEKGARVQTFLVFDQFEELLTLDPTDDEAKREFLRQVGAALRDGDRWALFAMREDYVGALDPFLPLLPTRLAVTFRLDLLRREAAGEAICRPSAEFGVTFEDGAVAMLVHELARIQVQDPLTGKSQPKDGLYVEPLHLQLVCQRLWKERAVPDRITAEDLDRLAHDQAVDVRGVAAALAHYYDDSVLAVAGQFASEGVTERAIRNWFSESLISVTGLRLPVLLGNEEAFGLSGAVLKALGDRYLIRSEQRHGGIYYELAHDRLVEPVQKSNAAWRKRLAPFQQAAELWKESGKKNDLLVADEVLEEGERLDGLQKLNKEDRTFLDACRQARDARAAREEKKQAQRRKRAYIVGAVLVVSVCIAGAWIFHEKDQFQTQVAQAQTQVADALAKAAQADLKAAKVEADAANAKTAAATKSRDQMANVKTAYKKYLDAWHLLSDDPGESLGMAIDSLKLFQQNSTEGAPSSLVTMLLPQSIANRTMQTFGTGERKPNCKTYGLNGVRQHTATITEMVLAKSKELRLVTRDIDGTVLAWDDPCHEHQKLPGRPCRRIPAVNQMMVTPDGKYLIVGHSTGYVCQWKMEDWKDADQPFDPQHPHDGEVTSLCVGPSAKRANVVAGYSDGKVQLLRWNENGQLTDTKKAWEVSSSRSISTTLLTPDLRQVFTNTPAKEVQSWDIGNWHEGEMNPQPGQLQNLKQITRIAVADMGKMFAAVTEQGKVMIYAMTPTTTKIGTWVLPGPEESERPAKVIHLAFSPIGIEQNKPLTFLVFAAWDNWKSYFYRFDPAAKGMENGPVEPLTFVQELRVPAVGFSQDGKRIAVGKDDGSAWVWWTNKLDEPPIVLRTAVFDPVKHSAVTPISPVTAVLFGGPDGRWLFTGQANGAVRRWDLDNQKKDFDEISKELSELGNDLSRVIEKVDQLSK